jgi:hypothetical protein
LSTPWCTGRQGPSCIAAVPVRVKCIPEDRTRGVLLAWDQLHCARLVRMVPDPALGRGSSPNAGHRAANSRDERLHLPCEHRIGLQGRVKCGVCAVKVDSAAQPPNRRVELHLERNAVELSSGNRCLCYCVSTCAPRAGQANKQKRPDHPTLRLGNAGRRAKQLRRTVIEHCKAVRDASLTRQKNSPIP